MPTKRQCFSLCLPPAVYYMYLLWIVYFTQNRNNLIPLLRIEQNDSPKVSEHVGQQVSSQNLTTHPAPHAHPKKLLCHSHRGRLGNKMFQFASLYSLSKFYGRQLVINSAMASELEKLFTMRLDNKPAFYMRGSCDGMKTYDYLGRGYRKGILNITYKRNFALVGFFESWKYFYHNMSEILSIFTIVEIYKSKAATIMKQHCPPNVTVIGIQVRRGDIRKQQKEAPWSYFQQAMQYYRRRHPRLHFLVTCSDRNWCPQHFRNTPDVTILTGSAYEDMAVLASCDHSIMSIGTYSWWSSMLAQGTVVYYSNIPSIKPPLKNPDDFFPPHWIPMKG